MDSAPPQGLPSATLQPTAADKAISNDARTLAEIEKLASMGNNHAKTQTVFSADKNLTDSLGTGKYESRAVPENSASFANVNLSSDCECCNFRRVNSENLKRLFTVVPILLHSKDALFATIFGDLCRGGSDAQGAREGGSQQHPSSERGLHPSKMSIEELDAITGNLMLNPVPFATRFFIKTLLQLSTSASTTHEILRNYIDCTPNPEVSLSRVLEHRDSVLGAMEIASMYRRFLGSVVRELSLCLSKESNVDQRYCYKIGRYAKLKTRNEDERTIESIR